MPFGEDLFVNVGARSPDLKYGTSSDDVRQKFTGYQKDTETLLDFAEARMYENRFGRFIAVDPLLASGKSADPQTFNRYAYTSNNPIDRVDRNGKDWFRVKGTYVTYGRTYTKWTPVWRNATATGDSRWTAGVYKLVIGEYAGKWAVLDPWNDRWTAVGSRKEAIAAYEAYRRQTRDDVIGGVVRAAAETVDSVTPLGELQPSQKLADKLLNNFGIYPDESADLYRVGRMLTHTTIAAGTVAGAELQAVRAGGVPKTISEAKVANTSARPVSTLEPGPFAVESIPARGPGPLNTAEQSQINSLGRKYGCHTCGSTDPGTKSSNFIGDHQRCSALIETGEQQRIYPHCLDCSRRQGGDVRTYIYGPYGQ